MRRKLPRAATALFVLSALLALATAASVRARLHAIEERARAPAESLVPALPGPDEAPTLSARVPEGLRAIPLAAPVPAALLAPGDRVDVLAVTGDRPFAETIARTVEVLEVLEGPADALGSTATLVLLVDPRTAERIAHARTRADLSVTIASEGGPPD